MSRERRTVIVAYFLLFCGAGAWVPYFPLYLATLGYDGWQIGVLIGLQPAVRWGSAILWAYAADRWRMRHRLLLSTTVAGSLFFIPLLFTERFSTMVLVLIAIALLHGGLMPIVDAIVFDHLPRLGGDYGRLRLWGSLGFIFGALVSAQLIGLFSPRILPLLLLIPALGLFPAFMGLPREQLGHEAHFRAPWALVTPPLAAFLATAFLVNVSSAAWSGFFALHTAGLGYSPTVPGVTWGLAVAAEVALLYWGRVILNHINPAPLIVTVLMLTVARWALTSVARNEAVVIGLQLGHAFTFSAFHLAALVLLSKLVPLQSSTGGQALYGMVAFGAGGSLGMLLAGALVGPLGTAGLFGFESLVALTALVPGLWLLRLTKR